MPDMPTYNPRVLAVSVEGRDGPLSKSPAVGVSHPNLGDSGDCWGLRGPWMVRTGWDRIDSRLTTPDVLRFSAESNLWNQGGSYRIWSPTPELIQKPGSPDFQYGLGFGLPIINVAWAPVVDPARVNFGLQWTLGGGEW